MVIDSSAYAALDRVKNHQSADIYASLALLDVIARENGLTVTGKDIEMVDPTRLILNRKQELWSEARERYEVLAEHRDEEKKERLEELDESIGELHHTA